MKILSIDIGGTYSRFGGFTVSNGTLKEEGEPFKVQTDTERFPSLEALIAFFDDHGPGTFSRCGQYDLIVMGVAGPVAGNRCFPPNIKWDIDLNAFVHKDRAVMINDFVAQAYGLVYPGIQSRLLKIGEHGASFRDGNIAVVGAGTGLGHCCLLPGEKAASNRFRHLPSEAGHTTFAFHGKTEKALEAYILRKKGIQFCTNDDVVSGSGLALIHAFLTDESIDPLSIDEGEDRYQDTLRLFSRLFGRACRNYCLATLTTQSLIITGGVAGNNRSVVTNAEFYEAFLNSRHRPILSAVNIYLNPGIETGLLGGAYYGMCSVKKKKFPR